MAFVNLESGVNGIVCFGDEIDWLASVTAHPPRDRACLLVRPVVQLGVGRQCPCPQQEVGRARGLAVRAVTPEPQTRDVSCERHRSPLSEAEGLGPVPVEGFVGPY